MIKKTLIVLLILLTVMSSFSLLGATEDGLQDFLDSVDNLKVTITQDNSTVEFDLDTFGASFDSQTILISDLLNGLTWNVEFTDGQRAHFHSFSVTSPIATILNFVLEDSINFDFLGSNANTLNTYLNDVNAPEFDGADTTFSKQGTHYTITTENGYSNADVDEIITNGVNSMSIPSLLDQLFAMTVPTALDGALEDLGFDLNNLDYNLSCADLTGIRLEDGTYSVPVQINCNSLHTEQITLILSGIVNEEAGSTDLSGSYAPVETGIKSYLIGINGLEASDNVEVSLFDSNPFPTFSLPSNVQSVIKFIEITVGNNTDAIIEFQVPTTDVVNPSLVSLYVFNTGTNVWEKLSTDFQGTSGGFHRYSAETPHFSTFMIMEQQETSSSSSSGGRSTRVREQTQDTELDETSTDDPRPIPAGPSDETANTGFFASITGAFLGALGGSGGVFAIVFIIAIVGLVVLFRTTQGLNKKK